MALEKKDVRLKLSDEAHRMLSAGADFHEKDLSEYGSLLLERALLGEGHVMKLQAERIARLGRAGNPGESPGTSGKRPLKAV